MRSVNQTIKRIYLLVSVSPSEMPAIDWSYMETPKFGEGLGARGCLCYLL